MSPTKEHDWALGFVYFAASIFIAALVAGFATLIGDTHDIKLAAEAAAMPARLDA